MLFRSSPTVDTIIHFRKPKRNVKALILLLFLVVASVIANAQSIVTIEGRVLDAKTKAPLSRATVKVKAQLIEIISNSDGGFEFRASSNHDTLEVSHIGYKTFKKRLSSMNNNENILMEDYSLQLRTVTVTSRKFNLREVDKSLRPIKGNLYAYETEITNGLYNLFLSFLEESGQIELFRICNFDLTAYDENTREFYEAYAMPYKPPLNKKDTLTKDYTAYPAINISHEAAVLFCQWFTEQYNSSAGKKKFAKVLFRLPTLKEWQIAALGYPKFQSWNLEENTVAVVIPSDTISESRKGTKTNIPVNKEILYPWWPAYNYRKKAQNHKNCYLGNFKIPENYSHCEHQIIGHDGWVKMSLTATYFPNDMGLYDVVGNVAEMIDEKGKACGGSWDDLPKESTISSVKSYTKPDDTIGFRVFIEVISE
jgi:formylglycine-generating enzyme required for sulfatase activity